jgi:hypothetical protein
VNLGRANQKVLNHLVVAGLLVAKTQGIHQIKSRVLAGVRNQIRARDEEGAGRAEILVGGLKGCIVVWSEIIEKGESSGGCAEFYDAVAETCGTIPIAVARGVIKIAARIDNRSAAGHPHAAILAIGGGAENAGLLQRLRVVGK